jgi:archaeal type IV pilus assembly protein PilA
MDLKKLFKDNDAVSPVIGVILMVAITVILAAAIGSSVFGEGPAKSAPQANIDIKASAAANNTTPASVKIEHLGGDTIKFGDSSITKVTASLNGGSSLDVSATSLGNVSVGDVKSLSLANSTGNVFDQGRPTSNDIVNIKIIDVKTNQLISNKDVRF